MHHFREHDPAERCDVCGDWPLWWLDLALRIADLKETMMTSQQHLEDDVKALADAIQAEVDALKAQPAAESLDFSSLDDLVAKTQAAAASSGGSSAPTNVADVPPGTDPSSSHAAFGAAGPADPAPVGEGGTTDPSAEQPAPGTPDAQPSDGTTPADDPAVTA